MSQQLYFTNESTGLTAVQPLTAMHLIEVGAHVRRDPRWRRQIPPPPPPPPPPPLPPPPPEYVHEWTTSIHVSFRRRAPGAPGRALTICKNRFRSRLKKIRCIDLTRD